MKMTAHLLLGTGLAGLAGVAMAAKPAPASTAASTATKAPQHALVAAPGITLEQAVAQVEVKTHGKVLRASSRQYGNATEYRIKVLTPDGHVRVIPVRSRQTNHSAHKPKETH